MKASSKKIVLTDVKTFNLLTGYRSITPEETITKNKELLSCINLRKITRLPLDDTFGMPVYKAEKDETQASKIFQYAYSKGQVHHSAYHNRLKPPNVDECYGKGLSNAQAKASAIMELLERNLSYKMEEGSIIYATHDEVKEYVIPLSKLLIPQSFQKYHDEYMPLILSSKIRIEWCWCYSLVYQKSFLIPANHVFWPYVAPKGQDILFFQTTNGLASGNTIEEAILHGIFENVERDAYQRMIIDKTQELKELDLIDIKDYCDKNLPEKFNRELAPNVIAFSVRNPDFDLRIHTLVAGVLSYANKNRLKRNRRTELELPGDKRSFYLLGGRGSSLNPKIAICRALAELVELKNRVFGKDDRCYITGLTGLQAFKKKINNIPDYSSGNIKEDIEICIDNFRKNGLDILVADLTHPKFGIPIVRVITPGLKHQDFRANKSKIEIN